MATAFNREDSKAGLRETSLTREGVEGREIREGAGVGMGLKAGLSFMSLCGVREVVRGAGVVVAVVGRGLPTPREGPGWK